MDWCRLWHSAPDDPKWRLIARKAGVRPGDVWAVATRMMVRASENNERGTIDGWDDEVEAEGLGYEVRELAKIREAMQGKFLEGQRLRGWSKRQPKDATAAERKRRQRSREVTNGHAPSRTVTVSHTDKKREDKKDTPPKSPRGVKKDFEEFYSEFPNKRGGPDDALKAYRAARRRAGHRQIMAGLMAYKENKEDWRAWKQAGPWLRAGMWKAEYGSPQSNGKPPEDWTADEWRKFLGKPDSWMAKRVKDYWPVRGRNFPDGAPKEILKEYGWE